MVVVIWVVGGRQSRPVKSCKDTVNIGNDEFEISRLVYQPIKDVTEMQYLPLHLEPFFMEVHNRRFYIIVT